MSRRPASQTGSLLPFLPLLLVLSAAARPGSADECLDCHANPTAEDSPPQLSADVEASSIHKTVDCVACHVESEQQPHGETPSFAEQSKRCGSCHEAADGGYGRSLHAKAVESGNAEAPACTTCHGEHAVAAVECHGEKNER